MVLRPVEKLRVAEGVAEQLRYLILTGSYRVGDKLPPERQLAKDLGVNRSSLREGLKKLEHMGLVKIRQGDGTRVLDFMQTGGFDLVSHLIPLAQAGHVGLLGDVLEFRRIYGREVAQLAAIRRTADDLERMGALADQAEATEDPAELLRLDFDFYVALTHASQNRVLLLLINTTRAAVLKQASFFAGFFHAADVVRRHHKEMMTALHAADATKAYRVADEYLARGAELAGVPQALEVPRG